MQIIKTGSLPANEIEATCSECQSILRGTKSEFKFISKPGEAYCMFECPVCSYQVFTSRWNAI